MSKDKYFPPEVDFTINGLHITTDGSVRKKMTGTSMGGILGVSPWSTPFQVACNLLGLATKDIGDKPAVKTGKALEDRIIRYLDGTFSELGAFIPAEEVFEKREGDHDSWASDWEDDYFAGHVDGVVMDGNGTNYILEIKTSANMGAWEHGVPEYYQWQVYLYNRFITDQEVAYVALGIVDQEVHRDPDSWNPSEDTVALYRMPIDRSIVEDGLARAREWYDTYIAKGITPDYDPENPGDVELYTHLLNITKGKDEIAQLIEELADLRIEIAREKLKLAPLEDREEELKSRIKDYMDTNSVPKIDSPSGLYYGVLTESRRSSVDPAKLKEAGIDPEPYTVVKISKSFTIKNYKE